MNESSDRLRLVGAGIDTYQQPVVHMHRDCHVCRDVAALSEAAWIAPQPDPDAWAEFSHPEPPASAAALRGKAFGQRLSDSDFLALMHDTVDNRLSDIELAAFVTARAGERLDHQETVGLTRMHRGDLATTIAAGLVALVLLDLLKPLWRGLRHPSATGPIASKPA